MNNSDAESLQLRMKSVRHELKDDVQEIVEGVREFGEWRSYVKAYPWVCVGTAVLIGYMMVPRKRESWSSALPFEDSDATSRRLSGISPPAPRRTNIDFAMSFASDAISRGVSIFLSNLADKVLASSRENSQERRTS